MIQSNLTQVNLDFEYIDALDACDYTSTEIEQLVYPPRRSWTNYLRAGAVCCALSHQLAYQKFLAREIEWCLILEDDVEINEADLNRLLKLEGDLPDVVLLNSYSIKKIEVFRAGFTPDLYMCRSNYPASAAAYFINKRAASEIIKYNSPVKATADEWSEFSKLGLSIGAIKPDVFEIKNLESTINYYDSWLKKIMPEFVKKSRRAISYFIRKKNIKLKQTA